MSKKFNLESLGSLNNGAAAAAIDAALQEVFKDCHYRPALAKNRTVTITVEVQPHYNDRLRGLDSVEVTAKVTTKVPAQELDTERLRAEIRATTDGEFAGVDVLFALPDQDALLEQITTQLGKGN
jgi:hypothetical protein